MRILVVGGMAAGMRAALTAKQLSPGAEIEVFERGSFIAYASCGLPYFVSGLVQDIHTLVHTTPEEIEAKRGVVVHIRQEVVGIDASGHRISVRQEGSEREEAYDRLILATGARPVKPGWADDLKNVFTLRTVEDALAIRGAIEQGAHRAVVIGGGSIGLEVAVAFREAGLEVVVLEGASQILPLFDPEIVQTDKEEFERRGVRIIENCRVEGLEEKGGAVAGVRAAGERIPADLVLVSVGVNANSNLFREAGGEVSQRGIILTDDEMRTSLPDIYAAGDCIVVPNLMSGRRTAHQYALTAHRTGEVAASNAVGRRTRFRGVIGTVMMQLFDLQLGKTGLSLPELEELGMFSRIVASRADSRASYHPDSRSILTKLYAGYGGRVLGAQLVGKDGVGGRTDVWAAIIQGGRTL
ncbi:MAG: FAD-dependent oxidoreductase, partial [Bacteroidota bacterium]